MHDQGDSHMTVFPSGSEEEENDPDLRPPETVNDPYSFHKQPPDDADADYHAEER